MSLQDTRGWKKRESERALVAMATPLRLYRDFAWRMTSNRTRKNWTISVSNRPPMAGSQPIGKCFAFSVQCRVKKALPDIKARAAFFWLVTVWLIYSLITRPLIDCCVVHIGSTRFRVWTRRSTHSDSFSLSFQSAFSLFRLSKSRWINPMTNVWLLHQSPKKEARKWQRKSWIICVQSINKSWPKKGKCLFTNVQLPGLKNYNNKK